MIKPWLSPLSLAVLLLFLLSCAKPLFVSHLSPEGIALTRKKGYGMPTHNYFSRFICFDEKCLKKAAYIKKQRSHRFKGYKDGGKPPRSIPRNNTIPSPDSTVIARQESPVKESLNSAVPTPDSIIVLNEVLFEVDSYKLRPEIFPKLDSVASFVNSKSGLTISISGHTDNTGTENHNAQLSENRAAAIATYLIRKGVKSDWVTSKGYGSTVPVMSNDTAEGRLKNRRVEILIHNRR